MKKLLVIGMLVVGLLKAQTPYLDSLKNVLKQTASDSAKCRILGALILFEYDEHIWPAYNKQIEELAKKNISSYTEPASKSDTVYLHYLGNAYANEGYYQFYDASDPEKALVAFSNAEKIFTRINDKRGLVDVYNSYAVVVRNRGDQTRAIDYMFKALQLSEQLKDKARIALALTNLGRAYMEEQNFAKAKAFYMRSMVLSTETQNDDGVANSLNSLGHLYCRTKQYDSALYCFKRALGMVEQLGDKLGINGVLTNIGQFYYNYGDPACDVAKEDCGKSSLLKAKEYYTRALTYIEKGQNAQGESSTKNRLAWVEFKLGNYKEARNLAQDGLDIARRIKFPTFIRNGAELMYYIEKREGNLARALDHYQEYILMRDSVRNVEHSEELLKRELKYEYDSKTEVAKANHDKELAIAAEREQKQKLVSIMVGVGLLLVLLFAGIIFNRLRVTNKQKKIIEEKNHVIEEKQKEILDSIHYAKRIQSTMLAHTDFLKEHIPSNFIYFKPKDIVSGDFYWATSVAGKQLAARQSQSSTSGSEVPAIGKPELFYLAVCDSTGHGVPGAFMSLLNIGFLSEAVNEKNLREPHEVFNYVRERLINSISKEGQKDGFDGILLCLDKQLNKLSYVAANNAPVIVRKNELIELPSNRMPVGIGVMEASFEKHEVTLNAGDTMYLFTDGFADQFGGPKGKKYKYKQLFELFKKISTLPMIEQQNALEQEFESWRGKLDQVDDVCVIGLRIND